MKRLKKNYQKFYVFLGQPNAMCCRGIYKFVLHKEVLRGGEVLICCIALNEDEVALLNLVLNFSIKPN
jgi:hypothetical protein